MPDNAKKSAAKEIDNLWKSYPTETVLAKLEEIRDRSLDDWLSTVTEGGKAIKLAYAHSDSFTRAVNELIRLSERADFAGEGKYKFTVVFENEPDEQCKKSSSESETQENTDNSTGISPE